MSAPQEFIQLVERLKIVDAARDWVGTPYVHQASAKGAGCDCLGLVRGVWRDVYGAEPEAPPAYTPDWNERRGDEPLLAAARRHMIEHQFERGLIADEGKSPVGFPGDVVVFRVAAMGPAKHCGILIGADRFVHAYAGREVVETWLNRWWRSRLVSVFSFPGVE